ncbi:MAG: (2Fe-2S) ferredoxin domain-containing protein [Pyramidobacter sp.]|nr:(2Fe-2S) ferredoxin domain-containing protein [Pyramidobacter sp.]
MLEVVICVGSSCHLKGAKDVVESLQLLIKERKLEQQILLRGSFCMGRCPEQGVSVKIGVSQFFVKPEEVEQFFDDEIIKRLEAAQ